MLYKLEGKISSQVEPMTWEARIEEANWHTHKHTPQRVITPYPQAEKKRWTVEFQIFDRMGRKR